TRAMMRMTNSALIAAAPSTAPRVFQNPTWAIRTTSRMKKISGMAPADRLSGRLQLRQDLVGPVGEVAVSVQIVGLAEGRRHVAVGGPDPVGENRYDVLAHCLGGAQLGQRGLALALEAGNHEDHEVGTAQRLEDLARHVSSGRKIVA